MSEPVSPNRVEKPRVSPGPTNRPHGVPEPSTDKLLKSNGEAVAPPTLDGARNFAVLEHLPAAVYTTDAEGRITFFNEAAAALWGRRPNLGEAWCGSWRLYWPDGRPMAHEQCPMARFLRSGEPIDGEGATLERPDGSRVDFLAYPKPLCDASGKPAGGLNMLVDVTESKQTAQNLRDSEARYRGIFQNVRVSVWEEDFSAILDLLDELRADGVTDPRAFFQANPDRLTEAIRRVRVIDVNDFSMELFAAETKDQLLNSLAVVFLPATDEVFIEELVALWEGRRQFENETMVRTLKGRHIDVLCTMAFEGERCQHTFVTLHDISAMKAAERAVRAERRHFRTLNKVAQIVTRDLDLKHVVQTVTDVATELSGARFGAFFYNVTDEKGESLLLYTLSGAPREAFEKFGLPRNTAVFEPTFRGRGIVRSDDIRSDPRYGKNAPHHGMPKGHLPVVSYLAVPVVSRSGEVIGGLFFGHPEPGKFSEESELLVMGVAAHAASAIDNARLHEAAQAEIKHRQRAEETKELLLNEVRHRVKNSLAMIQAIASQTFRSAAREEQETFAARLQALSGAYDLLTDQTWSEAPVSDVVERALAPFREGHPQRFQISGPEVRLDAPKLVSLAMALHELATNALKYGALLNKSGSVSLDWNLVDAEPGQRRIRIEWREAGGPPVTPPKRTGFGTKLIEQAFRSEGSEVQFDFGPQGAACVLEMPLD